MENMKRLFELSKSNMAGPEEFEAPHKLENLFKTHGEALVEALEEANTVLAGMYEKYGHSSVYAVGLTITELLMKIEKEAAA